MGNLHLTHHFLDVSSIFVPDYTCIKKEFMLYDTNSEDHPGKPINSLAHNPILILRRKANWLAFGEPFSNFILFLSYHNDHMTQPKIRPHIFQCFLLLGRPNHWMLKLLHWLWRTLERPHHSSIFIQALQEKSHENRTWEFVSVCRLQKGHRAHWASIIPFSTRKSPVLSFSRFANQTYNGALGGMTLCQTILDIALDKVGVDCSYILAAMLFTG